MRRQVILSCALFLSACQANVTPQPAPTVSPSATPAPTASPVPSPTPVPVPAPSAPALNTDFKLKFQQTVRLDETLNLTFIAVVQDSRCPAGVLCIRAGDVTVRLQTQTGKDAPQPLELTFGATDDKRKAQLGAYNLSLQAVDPVKTFSNEPQTRPEDYVLTLQVQKQVQK